MKLPNVMQPITYLGRTKPDDGISWAGGFDRNSKKWCNAACSRLGMRMLDAKTVFIMSTKPVSHIPQSARLPDRLREGLRYKHYSLHTKETLPVLGAIILRALAWAQRASAEHRGRGLISSVA